MKSQSCNSDIEQLAQQLGKALLQRGAIVTTAESCTGGGIAQAITAVPGSSQWFESGYITYANNAKQTILGVEQHILQQYGAVSEQVVTQMAAGSLEITGADYAIAVSGIAGPDGGSIEKPVGYVWICCMGPVKNHSQQFQFQGDRQVVREQAIKKSLQQLLHQLNE